MRIGRLYFWRATFLVLFSIGWVRFTLATELSGANSDSTRSLVVLGDSLSAGYGVDISEAWPALIQAFLRRDGMPWKVVNAGVSGDTTAAGLRRLDWLLRKPVDALILELGANDGLRGLPLEATRTNLQAVIDRTRTKWPRVQIILAGMRLPANMGAEYINSFEAIFPALTASNRVTLIPFLLEGVGGRPEFNQADQIHPNVVGHRRVAAHVWTFLKPVLNQP
ncbi:MAG: arylesterase [Pedosphaera sp.]|nr:arylesterase [Pedosphaera sp.]